MPTIRTIGDYHKFMMNQPSLVGYWPMYSNPVQVLDMSPNGLHATNAGSTFVGGRGQGGFNFDGVDDVHELGSIPSTHPLNLAGQSISIHCWFSLDATATVFPRLVDKSDGGNGQNGYSLYILNNSEIRMSVNGTGPSAVVTVPYNQLNHVVGIVHHDGDAEVWFNGTALSRSLDVPNIPSATTNMRFGGWNTDFARNWKGVIGEIAIFRRALRSDEIRRIHGAGQLFYYG